LSPCRA